MTEETMGTDFQVMCRVDGPTDDYESWDQGLLYELHNHKTTLYVDGPSFNAKGVSHPG